MEKIDKEELKKRTKIDWRTYVSEREVLDALVSNDEAKLLEIRECALKCKAYETSLHAQIDSGDQATVDHITSTFKYPKIEEL